MSGRECGHARTELVKVIKSNGTPEFWRQCLDCEARTLGVKAREVGSEEPVRLLRDDSKLLPPCVHCGARGVELHHWAPKAKFGAESELWPTSYLCPTCHALWHATMAGK